MIFTFHAEKWVLLSHSAESYIHFIASKCIDSNFMHGHSNFFCPFKQWETGFIRLILFLHANIVEYKLIDYSFLLGGHHFGITIHTRTLYGFFRQREP